MAKISRHRCRPHVELLEPRLALAAGDLVPEFGIGGMVTTEFATDLENVDRAADIARAPDGKYVMVGSTDPGRGQTIMVARLLSDGSLDSSFGDDGTVITPIASHTSQAHSVTVQSDGKVVVVGYRLSDGNRPEMLVLRYTVEGALDASFDGDGIASFVGNFSGIATDILVTSDNNILVVGSTPPGGSTGGFAALRLLPSGDPDPSFGNLGWSLLNVEGEGVAQRGAVTPDGGFVLSGWARRATGYDIVIARLGSDGILVDSFGTNGLQSFATGLGPNEFFNQSYEIAVQADGKIVVGGLSKQGDQFHHAIRRITSDGQFDMAFGSNGETVTPTTFQFNGGPVFSLDNADRIIVVSSAPTAVPPWDINLHRYTPDGELDESFGEDGFIKHVGGYFFDEVSVISDLDGNVTLAATIFQNGADFAAMRIRPDGSFDPTFGQNSVAAVNHSMSTYRAVLSDLAVRSDGRLMAAGTNEIRDEFVTRYLPSGASDPAFGDDGKLRLMSDNDSPPGILEGSDDTTFIFGSSNATGIGWYVYLSRLSADGSLDTSFADNGTATIPFAGSHSSPTIAAAVRDMRGGILLTGFDWETYSIFVLRFTADGELDLQFGAQGKFEMPAPNSAFATTNIALQRDGRIRVTLASGSIINPSLVVGLLPDGTLDEAFGSGGTAIVGGPFFQVRDLAVLRDGKLLFCGDVLTTGEMFVARYLSDGSPDHAFGNGGIVVRSPVGGRIEVANIVVLDDGRFVVSGTTASPTSDMVLIAHLPDGQVDPLFGQGGIRHVAFGPYDDVATELRLLASGDLILAGTVVTDQAKVFAFAKIEGFGAIQLPWRNHDNPFNVDDDAGDNVVPADAIAVIDALNLAASHYLPVLDSHVSPAFYLDVNGDNQLTPADAIMVIDYLNLMDALDGEGESAVAQSQETDAAEPQSTEVGFLWNQDTRSVPASSLDSGKSAPLSFAAARATKRQEMRISADWPVEQSNLPLTLDAKTTAEPPMLLELDELLECLAVGHLGLSLD